MIQPILPLDLVHQGYQPTEVVAIQKDLDNGSEGEF